MSMKKMTAIADAIREKTGNTELLTLDDMATAIASIKTNDTTVEDDLIENKRTTYTNDRVTKIAGNIFQNNQYLVEVSFPNVLSVGGSAFGNCPQLTTVNLPSVTSISGSAFYQSKKVTHVYAPNVVTLGSNAFRTCPMSKIVEFPKLTTTSTYAFQDCVNIEYLDIGKTTTIGTYTFYNCKNLTALVLRRSDKPVTLSAPSNAFTGTPIKDGTGYVYVPDDLVDDYKANSNWSTFAEQIKPMSELVKPEEEVVALTFSLRNEENLPYDEESTEIEEEDQTDD